MVEDLRNALPPGGRELYDRVERLYPRWEHSAFLIGTSRRRATEGDAFRHLMRSVIDETTEPQRWQREVWPDAQVVEVCSGPENIRLAWAQLASDDPESWVARWQRRQRADKIGTAVIGVVLIVAAVVGVVMESYWPIAIAAGILVIALCIAVARAQTKQRGAGRPWPRR